MKHGRRWAQQQPTDHDPGGAVRDRKLLKSLRGQPRGWPRSKPDGTGQNQPCCGQQTQSIPDTISFSHLPDRTSGYQVPEWKPIN
ncbi:Cortactin-Binding Protein 2 [Manis pentadactyla]|nr:Cortactin-Binding Protein 2 [Manis pentadactyla]